MSAVVAVHAAIGWILLLVAVGLGLASAWSFATARRTAGARDHRFLVDRLALSAVGLAALGAAIGLVLLGTGPGAADPLHLVYGAAAVLAVPVAVSIGLRRAGSAASRASRDAWMAVGGAVLAGVALRLIGTG